jgi:DNA (cytosine-5)-methyltransferase 1
MMTAIDLFCGAGGLSLGFEWAGYKVIFASDVERSAMETYTKNRSDIIWLNKDIRKVSVEEIRKVSEVEVGDIDVLMGGIPCEGFSTANSCYNKMGQKNRLFDARNYLFKEFLRCVKGLKPKAVLIENVPNISNVCGGIFVDVIKRNLEKEGYGVSVLKLSAVNYGVPQFRKRLFFVGLSSGKKVEPPIPICDGEEKPFLTVCDGISDLPPLRTGEEKTRYESEPKTEYQKLMRGNMSVLYNHRALNHAKKIIERFKEMKEGERYGSYGSNKRMWWNRPANTIIGRAYLIHPKQARELTVRERARLQSFPDKYIFYGTIEEQIHLVGDAVPPLLAKAIADELVKYL